MQIEVEPVRSTEDALVLLAAAATEVRPFDLVISDWKREAEGPMAGLRLLQAMRAAGHGQPVACCHCSFDTLRRMPLLTDTDACFGVCGLKAMEEGVVLALALAGTAHAASPACWRAPSAPYTLCIGAGQGIVLVLDRV